MADVTADLRAVLQRFDHELSSWERAYPTSVFGESLTEEEQKQVTAALNAAGFTSERVHASWARHVVGCIAVEYAHVRAEVGR